MCPMRFVVCIENKNHPVLLEFGKISRVLEDEKAAPHKMIRVSGDLGEDFLYPEKFFVAVKPSSNAEDAFMAMG